MEQWSNVKMEGGGSTMQCKRRTVRWREMQEKRRDEEKLLIPIITRPRKKGTGEEGASKSREKQAQGGMENEGGRVFPHGLLSTKNKNHPEFLFLTFKPQIFRAASCEGSRIVDGATCPLAPSLLSLSVHCLLLRRCFLRLHCQAQTQTPPVPFSPPASIPPPLL
jgi:hypothetical protein